VSKGEKPGQFRKRDYEVGLHGGTSTLGVEEKWVNIEDTITVVDIINI